MSLTGGSLPTSVRGEHYAKKIFDLGKFLTAVVYPALDKYLDHAFPEFQFRRIKTGYWVAQSAPVHYRGYGARQGRLIATGWGFRSLGTGEPAILWLSYVNKRTFPKGRDFLEAVRKLGKKVRITFDWDASAMEIEEAIQQERRDHMLEAFLAYAQGQLMGDLGKFARGYLSRNVGFPLHKLHELDLGYYSSAPESRHALHEAGFDREDDDNMAEVLGLFHPKWEGRIIGPWWDINGYRVVNFWGRFPGETPVGESVYVNLNRPDPGQPFGSRETPIGLHLANRLQKRNLVLLESPLKSLMAYSLGLEDPFPIAAGGEFTTSQAETLRNQLKRSGTLTVNFDYEPNAKDIHARTSQVLNTIGGSSFPLYVIDPVEMAGRGNYPKPVDPALFIRTKGIQAFRALLSKRTEARHYRGQSQVFEYDPSDPNFEESPRDVIDSVESLANSMEDRQRAPELDNLFNQVVLRDDRGDYADHVDSPEGVSPDDADQGMRGLAYQKILDHAQSILEHEGMERATSYLQGEVKKFLQGRSEEIVASPAPGPGRLEEEAATRVSHSEDRVRARANDLGKRIKSDLEGAAEDVTQGDLSAGEALHLLADCQEGLRLLIRAVQEIT